MLPLPWSSLLPKLHKTPAAQPPEGADRPVPVQEAPAGHHAHSSDNCSPPFEAYMYVPLGQGRGVLLLSWQ